MLWFLEVLGELIDVLTGPSITSHYLGNVRHETFALRPTNISHDVEVEVRSRRIVYHTRYLRQWIPDKRVTVYEVTGIAPPEFREKVDHRFFDVLTYPMLCNGLLKWTEYPHTLAIHAFLERIHPTLLLQQAEI